MKTPAIMSLEEKAVVVLDNKVNKIEQRNLKNKIQQYIDLRIHTIREKYEFRREELKELYDAELNKTRIEEDKEIQNTLECIYKSCQKATPMSPEQSSESNWQVFKLLSLS